jgi:hypothetical protein
MILRHLYTFKPPELPVVKGIANLVRASPMQKAKLIKWLFE